MDEWGNRKRIQLDESGIETKETPSVVHFQHAIFPVRHHAMRFLAANNTLPGRNQGRALWARVSACFACQRLYDNAQHKSFHCLLTGHCARIDNHIDSTIHRTAIRCRVRSQGT